MDLLPSPSGGPLELSFVEGWSGDDKGKRRRKSSREKDPTVGEEVGEEDLDKVRHLRRKLH